MYSHLFSEFTIQGVTLKNRLTMAPLYLGYAGEGGTVSPMLLDHYRLMAKSGVAMVVVENATVDSSRRQRFQTYPAGRYRRQSGRFGSRGRKRFCTVCKW